MADRTERQQLVDEIVASLLPGGAARGPICDLADMNHEKDPIPLAEAIADVAADWFARNPNVITGGPRHGLAAMNPAQRAVTVVLIVIGTLAALLVAAIAVGLLALVARAVWAAVLA